MSDAAVSANESASPRPADRRDLVAFGAASGTAYSELTEPLEQRRRLEAQSVEGGRR